MDEVLESESSERGSQSHGGPTKALSSERVPRPVQLGAPFDDRAVEALARTELPGDALLDRQLDKAQRLLVYAAEAGITIEDALRNDVLRCRTASKVGWSDERSATLLAALTKIAIKVYPVTVESLAITESPADADKKSHSYRHAMYALFAILVPYSILTFCTARLSDAIQKDIEVAHQLGVKLNDELYRPANQDSVTQREVVKAFSPGTTQGSVIEDLTQFAQAIRAINWDAKKLNAFVLYAERPPYEQPMLELEPGLTDFAKQANERVQVFQKVRYFAQSVQKDASIWYGAIANCILPLLYAILGALAYLLRSFEEQVRTRTLVRADGHAARFAIAAIGGFVVGLFNVSMAQSATISPLAIAFLVGYAVDVFFSFLQGLIQSFARAPLELSANKASPRAT